MATFTKQLLSACTDGRPILIAATGSAGTTVHTAHASSTDEIWLWASNTASTSKKLTIELGGTSDPDDQIEVGIPAESGLVLVLPGLLLTNSLVVKAFSATTNVVNVVGFVNRIT